MKNLIPLLKRSKLFSGVGEDGIVSMLNCLNATSLHFKKGDYIFRQGDIYTASHCLRKADSIFKKKTTGGTSVS